MEYFAFQWHITDECDQRCKHCYLFAEGHPVMTEMSWERLVAVLANVERMAARLNRLPYLYITGGDPILHSRFWDFLELVHSHDIPFTIMGNPFHLTTEVCQRLKQLGCRKYQLSIDGLSETHDYFRKPGSFDATLRAIKTIREAGLHCAVMTTVSGTNIHEIPQIIDLVVEHHVDIFAFGRYCPTKSLTPDPSFPSEARLPVAFPKERGVDSSAIDDLAGKGNHSPLLGRGVGGEAGWYMSPSVYRDLLDQCWQKFEEYKGSDTTFNLKDHLWTLYLYERGLWKIPQGLDEDTIYDGCNCGNCHFTISAEGRLMACRRFDSYVGTVDEEMADVWTSPRMEQYRQHERFEKCRKCELLRFCRGCPAVAYGYAKNFYAPDPQCWHI